MDFEIPAEISGEVNSFGAFIKTDIIPDLPRWCQKRELPRTFFQKMGKHGWYGWKSDTGRLVRKSALKESLITEALAKISPGVAIAVLAHIDLGLMGLGLFGSTDLQQQYGIPAVEGRTVMCLGNTENIAGSDVAGIGMTAEKVDGGWKLSGTKAYVTNGLLADWGIITAVSDPAAERKKRLSMYLVDLNADGIRRKKLNKQVWIPSDLTRLSFNDVFVADNHLLGIRGRGLNQVLEIFTNSRVPIAALTLGSAVGAFDLAVKHMQKRKIFGKNIMDFQAKAYELSDFYAKMQAVRLLLYKACWLVDRGEDFREASSLAKYLSVEVARDVARWAADIFGAASVIQEHPIHKFPMDVWGSALGEGTQDVQKLIIFREVMKRYDASL